MIFKRIATLAMVLLIAGCHGESDDIVSQPPDIPEEPARIQIEPWADASRADLVAAARYAGLYAVADRVSDSIVIYDVHQNNRMQVTADDLMAALPVGSDIYGDDSGPVALAFSASGRLLFMTVASADQAFILKFNTNTKVLTTFVSGLNFKTHSTTGNLGLAHHNGVLWVGTGNGQILRYQAERNDTTGTLLGSQTLDGHSVLDIAIDSADRKGYISTPKTLYRLDTVSSSIELLLNVSGLKAVSFGRSYGREGQGREGQGGLYLLSDGGQGRDLLRYISTYNLRQNADLTPEFYSHVETTSDIAMTADGRMLLASSSPVVMRDLSDERLAYDDWLKNEYEQYITYFRTLLWPDGKREGWVSGSEARPGLNRYKNVDTGPAGWVVLALIVDEDMFNRSAEEDVKRILTRYAGLHGDGVKPELTSDGLYFSSYDPDTGEGVASGSQYDGHGSIYATGKLVHAALRAREFYPDNRDIQAAAKTIIHGQQNYADYLRRYGKVDQQPKIHGPSPQAGLNNAKPYQESYLFAELAPLVDPLAFWAYEDWWKHRENHKYQTSWLNDEPVIKHKISSFVEQYGHILFKNHRQSAAWRENFNNFYGHQAAWTDDNNPDYLTAFSAGGTETVGYNADNVVDHTDTITHFPAVLGFGMYGNSAPLVGGYFAYRDGRRQKFKGQPGVTGPDGTIGAHMLTRYSNENPLGLTH